MASHVSEGSGTNEASDNDHSVQTPNRRSKVWEFFEKGMVEEEGGLKAICKYCGMKLKSSKKSGTNSLRNHAAQSCRKIPAEDRKRFVESMKKKPEEGSFTFDPRTTREWIVKWCISAEVPFNKFDDPCFAPMMESLQPSFSGFGRQTLRNDCVDRYKMARQELRDELQNLNSRVCFTSDLWTSIQKLGYICVTAHYVDSNFVLKKKIIGFREVKYPHTGLAVEEAMSHCLSEWGIKKKMFTLTLDNASYNKTACDLLKDNGKGFFLFGGEHLYVRCCAHILNLLVQDGMSIIHTSIELIRELVRHIISSPARLQMFNDLAQRAGLAAKAGLILDVPTRWNSTHDMLMEALKYKAVFKRYAEEHAEPAPTDEEWANAKAIGDFLEAFAEGTKTFSAHKTPTSHLFLQNVLCINRALRDPGWQGNEVLKNLANAMQDKFDKYWNLNFNTALVLSTVLDPTKKMDFLGFFYEKVCRISNDIDICLSMAKEWLQKYFEAYEKAVRGNNGNPTPRANEGQRSVGSPVLGKKKMEEEFAQYRSIKKGRYIPDSELDAYLKEDFVRGDENYEILSWWKANANKYPVLSMMARDFLAIPLSTVSSESAFSLGGRLLGDTRSSMTPETLEALVCGKDWRYGFPNTEVSIELNCL